MAKNIPPIIKDVKAYTLENYGPRAVVQVNRLNRHPDYTHINVIIRTPQSAYEADFVRSHVTGELLKTY